MIKQVGLTVLVLASVLMAACAPTPAPTQTPPTAAPAQPPGGDLRPTAAAAGTNTGVPPSPTSPPPTSAQAQPTATTARVSSVDLNKADPCALVTKADAEQALGKPIKSTVSGSQFQDPLFASVGCMHNNEVGRSYVMARIYRGDGAKATLLNAIAQTKAGCKISFSSPAGKTPTPLPSDVQALKSKTLKELLELHQQAYQDNCKATPNRTANLGDAATDALQNWVGSLVVVKGDALLAISVFDRDLDQTKRREAEVKLAQKALGL